MDANQVVMISKCVLGIFAIGLAAWGAVVLGRYAKWAVQLSRLAARAGQLRRAPAAVAIPVCSSQVNVRDYVNIEQLAEPVLQLESVI